MVNLPIPKVVSNSNVKIYKIKGCLQYNGCLQLKHWICETKLKYWTLLICSQKFFFFLFHECYKHWAACIFLVGAVHWIKQFVFSVGTQCQIKQCPSKIWTVYCHLWLPHFKQDAKEHFRPISIPWRRLPLDKCNYQCLMCGSQLYQCCDQMLFGCCGEHPESWESSGLCQCCLWEESWKHFRLICISWRCLPQEVGVTECCLLKMPSTGQIRLSMPHVVHYCMGVVKPNSFCFREQTSS